MSTTRSFLTNEQKLRLREYWGAQPQLTHFEVANWVRAQFQTNVSRSTLYRIAQAPDAAFAGSLSKKKTRRVKFPEFEKELLAYYHACQSTSNGGGNAVSGQAVKIEPLTADSLVRKAVELRAKHGISHDKLKLSNGWMHKFKERHCLKKVPAAAGVAEAEASDRSASEEDGEEESKEESAEDTQTAGDVPAANTLSTPRRAARSAGTSNDVITPSAMTPVTPVNTAREPAVLPSPVAPVAAAPAAPTIVQPPPSQHIQQLIHISAKSLSTVRSPGTLNWERTNFQVYHQSASSSATDSHFAIVNNGIQILRDGVYQINVDLQYTNTKPGTITEPLQEVFSVWNGTTRLDQCVSVLHRDASSGVALSVSEVQCFLAADACIRVDFKAPGHALHKSRIVVRLAS